MYIDNLYKKHLKNYWLLGIFLFILTIFLIFTNISTGSDGINFKEFFGFFGKEFSETSKLIIFDIRLPRILSAIIAGCALAVASGVLQNLLQNPLASPFTLGISQAAAFGATISIVMFKSLELANPSLNIALFAFIGSLIGLGTILSLYIFARLGTTAIILAGIALNTFFGASIMLLQYFASDTELTTTLFWTFGDLNKATYNEIIIMAIVTLIGLIYIFLNGWNYNAMNWGEDSAKSLGVSVKKLMIISMIMSCLITAVVTSFLGVIGFVGLVSPHIIRLIVGEDYRFLLPLSALTGACILLLSDIISHSLLAPIVIPVGIITSFLGVPLFLYLLIKRARI